MNNQPVMFYRCLPNEHEASPNGTGAIPSSYELIPVGQQTQTPRTQAVSLGVVMRVVSAEMPIATKSKKKRKLDNPDLKDRNTQRSEAKRKVSDNPFWSNMRF